MLNVGMCDQGFQGNKINYYYNHAWICIEIRDYLKYQRIS
jgi:hypothetical protein